MADRLYETDPESWLAYLAEGNARQPRKRVAADVIIRNQAGRLLLVNPNYKPDWDVPGGMAEANESPLDAARREIQEELGLALTIHALLCIDWVPPHGPWDDTLVFVFDGGILTPAQVDTITMSDRELDAFNFFTNDEAAELLRPYVWSRTAIALDALGTGRPRYAHYGSARLALGD
jgi:8-oxo-dGTP pyrophosphatase MutT (NUDIX family)